LYFTGICFRSINIAPKSDQVYYSTSAEYKQNNQRRKFSQFWNYEAKYTVPGNRIQCRY